MNLNTANAFFSKRPYTGNWEVLSDEEKESMLFMSNLIIRAHYQILPTDPIPDGALLEQTIFIANKGDSDVSQIQAKGVKYFKASIVSESYFEDNNPEDQAISPMTALMLNGVYTRKSTSITIDLRR